jgi:ubiquitin-conjugating enzyme E2 I
MEERKTWRLDHPHGFFARMAKNKDDSNNVFKWETGIPGKVGEDTVDRYCSCCSLHEGR